MLVLASFSHVPPILFDEGGVAPDYVRNNSDQNRTRSANTHCKSCESKKPFTFRFADGHHATASHVVQRDLFFSVPLDVHRFQSWSFVALVVALPRKGTFGIGGWSSLNNDWATAFQIATTKIKKCEERGLTFWWCRRRQIRNGAALSGDCVVVKPKEQT